MIRFLLATWLTLGACHAPLPYDVDAHAYVVELVDDSVDGSGHEGPVLVLPGPMDVQCGGGSSGSSESDDGTPPCCGAHGEVDDGSSSGGSADGGGSSTGASSDDGGGSSAASSSSDGSLQGGQGWACVTREFEGLYTVDASSDGGGTSPGCGGAVLGQDVLGVDVSGCCRGGDVPLAAVLGDYSSLWCGHGG